MIDNTQLTDNEFEAKDLPDNELLVFYGKKEYALAIVDTTTKKLKVLTHAQKNLFDDEDENLLKLNHQNVKISFFTDKYTFVPDELFKDEHLSHFASFLDSKETDRVLTTSFLNFKTKNIFAVPNKDYELLLEKFPGAKIFSQAEPFINGVDSQLNKANFSTELYINLRLEVAEFLIFKEGQFNFYNIFEYTNEDEFLYFMMLVAQQNNLDSTIAVKISGVSNLPKANELVKQTFINCNKLAVSTIINNEEDFNTTELSVYFSLLSLYLCE